MAKIKLKRRGDGRRFPVIYDIEFIGTLKPGEIDRLKKKIQKAIKAVKTAQERKGLATPVFNLRFKWTRTKDKAVRYKLVVTLVRDKRFKTGGGPNEVPPKPKDPSIPQS